MHIRFPGKTVMVTGAVRGIGRGIVHAFAARGARVLACDTLADELDAVGAQAAPEDGGEVISCPLDVTDPGAVAAVVAKGCADSVSGAIDILVHSAGGVLGQSRQALEDIRHDDWRAIQDVNVNGAFYCAQAVAPGMKRAGGGRIVIISSRAGLGVSLTGIHSYGTAKAAQIGLVRQLAHELGRHAITVNSVAPGFMRTSPDYERQWQSYPAAQQQAIMDRTDMGRPGEPADIAHAVLFFASDHASWVTGQTLAVTGSA